MDPIAKTAYYCCGVRADDARRARPLCGDTHAQRFMTPAAEAVFSAFRGFTAPNATNAARHRVIDDWLRQVLAANPTQRIIVLGAGFDTRAFRLSGGNWLELDQPAIIAEKEARLAAAEAPNPLTRIAIDFGREVLAEKLAPFAGENAVVVIEGVTMYLEPAQLRATLDTLGRLIPRHVLICDLMTAAFNQRFGGKLRARIEALGGHFATLAAHPEVDVATAGYRQMRAVSLAGRAIELGGLSIPKFLLNTLFRTLRDGYRAFWFERIG